MLHIFPHWNLRGHEGEPVEVWAYGNCDEVELLQDGHSLGRQSMEKNGHLVWKTTYRPGRLVAYGYRNGKKVLTERVETTGEAENVVVATSKSSLRRDGQDVVVIDLTLMDGKGRYVPDACEEITVDVEGGAEILGYGNGDPGFKGVERPQGSDRQPLTIHSFMGNAQVILRSRETAEPVLFTAMLKNGKKAIARF